MVQTENVESHLLLAAECDTIREWYFEADDDTREELSYLWGNDSFWTQERIEKFQFLIGKVQQILLKC